MNVIFDFDNQADADKSLKKTAQMMGRAGQNVVSYEFDPKVKRTSGVNYREASMTVASGQTVTLRIKATGDVFQVLLNGSIRPIKNQSDHAKAIGEIAAMLEANQAKFQQSLAKKRAELPKGIKSSAPRMEQALKTEVEGLDAAIAETRAKVDSLRAELGEPAMDSAGDSEADDQLNTARQLAAEINGGMALDGVDVDAFTAALESALDSAEGDDAESIRAALDALAAHDEPEGTMDSAGGDDDDSGEDDDQDDDEGPDDDDEDAGAPSEGQEGFAFDAVGDIAPAADVPPTDANQPEQYVRTWQVMDATARDYKAKHKTFSEAVQEAYDYAEKNGYEVDADDRDRSVAMGPRKPSEGKTNRYSIALLKDGKPQRKALQIQVYGLGDQGYELNCYIN